MRVELHPVVKIELAETVRYYHESRRGYGARFYDAFHTTADWLRQYPEIGPRKSRQLRRKRILGFPYDLMYRVFDDHILIVAIAHHARGPEYLREVRGRR